MVNSGAHLPTLLKKPSANPLQASRMYELQDDIDLFKASLDSKFKVLGEQEQRQMFLCP